MKHQFPFVGVQSPARKAQTKPLIAAARQQPVATGLAWVRTLAARTAREYTYAAIDLADSLVPRVTLAELASLRPLLLERPWWDSVDGWRKVYGDYLARHPEALGELFSWFYGQPSFWQRRVAITLQLMQKQATDRTLLTRAILDARTDPEFFLQKAIGWALRQYAKTDPAWVREFLATHQLSALANREASKHL